MKFPVISVIVTCYNQAQCIGETLESVAAQSYKHWECIVIDDGSTDTSAEVIQEFTKRDSRFTYHYQKNQGVSIARNKGFSLARGEYINFLDGDDTFFLDKLDKQLQVFQDHPDIGVCICDHQFYHELEDKYAYYKFEKIEQNPTQQLLYGWHNGVAFPPHAVLYKKNIWDRAELPFDQTYKGRAEDWIFNITVALKGRPYFFLEEVLCTYHHGMRNFTANHLNNESAFLEAAVYMFHNLPIPNRNEFLNKQIKQTLERYAEKMKPHFYRESGNWRLGNALTKPLFRFKNSIQNLKF